MIRAGQIIRRLRDFVARGKSEKRVENLPKMVEEAGALGLAGAREQGVSIRFELDPGYDLVLVDRVQIQQVLVNLFRNALEAMAQSTQRELIVSNRAVGVPYFTGFVRDLTEHQQTQARLQELQSVSRALSSDRRAAHHQYRPERGRLA
jgi:C4-dicarboxylate-specific signal transduction histidine kinase